MASVPLEPAVEPAAAFETEPVAARSTKQRLTDLAQHHSYAFAALLMVAALIATIAKNGNFAVSDQLGIAAPMILAAMASAPSIIGRGFDLSISPLLVFCNAVYVVWLARPFLPTCQSRTWLRRLSFILAPAQITWRWRTSPEGQPSWPGLR